MGTRSKEVVLTKKGTPRKYEPQVKSEIGTVHSTNLGILSPRMRLEIWYDRLSELTKTRCGAPCGRPGYCCKPEFCEMTIRHAKDEFNVQLSRTKHPSLPLMGPNGCTVAPYLRPICTKYICEKHLEDPKFAEEYRWIRDKIEAAELELASSNTPPREGRE